MKINALKSQKEEAENNLKTYEVAEAGTEVNVYGETHEVKVEGKSYRESVMSLSVQKVAFEMRGFVLKVRMKCLFLLMRQLILQQMD